MYAFLTAHDKHQVVMWSDSQDEGDWPAELVALLARRETDGADKGDRRNGEGGVTCVAEERQAGWLFGHYQVLCLDCREKHEIDEPETLRAFDTQLLGRKAVGLMLSRWGKLAPDDGWNHALSPAVDPYGSCMEKLLAFLKRHRKHRLEAAVRARGNETLSNSRRPH